MRHRASHCAFCILHSAFCIITAVAAVHAATLPEGYVERAYIESTGTQYIDTKCTPTPNFRAVVDFSYTTGTGAGGFGYGATGSAQSFRFWREVANGVATYSVNINDKYGTVNTFSATYENDTSRHVVDLSNTAKSFDGVSFGATSGLTKTLAGSLYLFATHWGWSPYIGSYGAYRVYSCRLYESATLVRDFVPCSDGNGKAGLYDLANGEMYYNKASGADFVLGPATAGTLTITGRTPSGAPLEVGSAVPAYGSTNELVAGASFVCSVPEAWTNAACDTIATCLGYTVYTNGSVYMEGNASSFMYVHPANASDITLVWQWGLSYPMIETTALPANSAYIRNGLVVHYDGLENAGAGLHNAGITVWKDLTGNGHDLVLAAGDEVGADRVKIAMTSRTASNDVFAAFTRTTFEFNARPTAMDAQGSWNSDIARIPYIGGLGWAAHSNSRALCVTRPKSETDKNYYYRSYDSGYASLADLISAATFQTYAARPGLGVKSAAASPAFVNGAAAAATTGLNWESTDNRRTDSFALVVGGTRTASDVRAIRIYNRELTAEEIAVNAAVDRIRFDGAPLSTLPEGWRYTDGVGLECLVTASAGEGGTVSPAEQWVPLGGTVTVTAITNAPFAFGKWTNGVPDSVRYENPATFTVSGPCEAVAVFAVPGTIPSYAYRLIANGGDYRQASRWEDGRVPPGDAANDDIFVAEGAGGNMDHTLPFRSLTFEKGAKTYSVWSYSNCKVGAGGVTAPDDSSAGVYGYTHVTLLCSQRWLFNGTGTFTSYGGYTLPEDAVWTLCGPNTLSVTRPAPAQWTALGRMRSNMTFNFSAYNLAYLPTNGLYWTNNDLDGGHVKTNALGVPNISLSIAHADDPDIPVPPIEWDFTNPKGAWQRGTGNTGVTLLLTESSYGGRMRFGAWSGRINDGVVKIDYRAGKNLFNPYRAPRMVLANPGTLDTSDRPRVWWKRGMLEIGDDNAFGVSNRLSLLIGHAGIGQDTYGDGWGGIAAGIVAAPGITVGSDMCVSNADVYYTLGRQVWLGAMDAGEPAVFTGDVENNDAMLSKSLMWARCPSQIRLFSGRGAEAQFTGSFSGSALLPMEIHGWGATRLSGDNSGLKAGVSVRSGTLKVGAENTLGHHPVSLGGTVPQAIDVGYYSSTSLTFKAGAPLIVDGCEVQPGERVLNMTRVYKLADDGSSFAADPDVSATAYGIRANITNGVVFAGTAFQCVHAFNNSCAFVEEPPEPSAALLADGAITITNDVSVTDNHSSGASTIGGCTADISVFSGNITLARGVTFATAAGGIVRFTGSVADAGENLNSFAFSGTGTVELPAGIDMGGREVSFPDLTDEALDATGLRACTLVTAPGDLDLATVVPPSISKWQLRVKPTSIRAVTTVGTMIFMR